MTIAPPSGARFPLRPVKGFDELQEGGIYPLGAFSVSADEIVEFARRYDPQPMHLEPGPDLCASGWQIGALTMRLMCEGFLLGSGAGVSPGIDQMRWLRPLKPDEWWTGRLTVVSKRASRSRPDRGVVEIRVDLTAADGRPAAELRHTVLWSRN